MDIKLPLNERKKYDELIINYLICEIGYDDLLEIVNFTLHKARNYAYFRELKDIFNFYFMREWLEEINYRKN